MTLEILLVLAILSAALVLFVTGALRMDLVALMVMGSLALTELVSPVQAISGFSNPAVITIWAVLILSGGLARTGVAGILGRQVLWLGGRQEVRLVVVIMLSAGVLSAFMNNVAVAALMLPVVLDVARRTGVFPSRLLMPLAFGCLLGGLTTLIGTPPNLLISNALRDHGLAPFRFFDFAPVGLAVLLAGTGFVAAAGRLLLPRRDPGREAASLSRWRLRRRSDWREAMLLLKVPIDSPVVGKSLAESRLGAALGLHLLAVFRQGKTILAPTSGEILRPEDRLLVQGRLEGMDELEGWRQLVPEEEEMGVQGPLFSQFAMAELRLNEGSSLIGKTLRETDFRRHFGVNVLAIGREGRLIGESLEEERVKPGDRLLVQGAPSRLENLKESADFERLRLLTDAELENVLRNLKSNLFVLRLPPQARLAGHTLAESRLGDALDLRVLAILRGDGESLAPSPDEPLQEGDRLVVGGSPGALGILRGLQTLEVEREVEGEVPEMESAEVGIVEAILSPQTTLAGKTLRQLRFREKYGLSVLAIWREGRALTSDLRNAALHFGDALLLYGPRQKAILLARDPDFLVLSEGLQEPPRSEKAPLAVGVMLCVILPVMVGWVPIFIAAVMGAALMVLTRCLTMEEAYRHIEWPAIFLIAGMLPLGMALDQTGAARFLAEPMVAAVGSFGPLAAVTGFYLATVVAAFAVPPPALVVLMAPIVLTICAELGISPHSAMMAMAMAASPLLSPISHPANLLVMGPGGYRFTDYLRVGLPLTLVVFLTVLLILPLFWPLQG